MNEHKKKVEKIVCFILLLVVHLLFHFQFLLNIKIRAIHRSRLCIPHMTDITVYQSIYMCVGA